MKVKERWSAEWEAPGLSKPINPHLALFSVTAEIQWGFKASQRITISDMGKLGSDLRLASVGGNWGQMYSVSTVLLN